MPEAFIYRSIYALCIYVPMYLSILSIYLSSYLSLHHAAFGSGLILPVGGGFRLGPVGLGEFGAYNQTSADTRSKCLSKPPNPETLQP